MTEEAKPTPREQLLERERCTVCGLVHPHIKVCPFIEEHEVRIEFGLVGEGRRRARVRVERTRYFPRPQIFEALERMTPGGRRRRVKKK